MNYDTGLSIVKTDNTLSMDFTDGRANITFADGSTNFYPTQLQFHAPSEHTVNGFNYDLEMQIVHTLANGSLGGIISIFFDVEKGGMGLMGGQQ